MKKQFSLLFFLIYVSIAAISQNTINFNGKIMSKSGFVFNVTILNKATKTGTVSSIDGDFSLYTNISDTIRFSCIGYKSFEYIMSDTLNTDNFRVIITMVEDTVMLKETIVTPWPLNTSALKRAFLAEKNENTTPRIAFNAGFVELDRPQVEPGPNLMSPISLIAYIFSKKRIAKAKTDMIRRKLKAARENNIKIN